MAIQLQLENGSLVGGGGAAFKSASVQLRPIDHGTLGHYRTAVKLVLATGQSANARLFEMRNAGSNLLVPTMIEVRVLPIGAVANPYALDLSLFKCTNFLVADVTNALTPTVSILRNGMAAPGNIHVRYCDNAVAGMGAGTLTKDTNPIGLLSAWMASVSPTSMPVMMDFVGNVDRGLHPIIFAQNEGLVIENVVVGSAMSNQIQVSINVGWAEVPAY